jgi:hypothetical protein
MIERLRRKAFLPESRKGLNLRFGIAEAAQLLGCSTNRIRMAEDDGRLPPPPPERMGGAWAIPSRNCSTCAKCWAPRRTARRSMSPP